MYPRFYNPLIDESFFLFGPRGTGKTTWLKHTFPQAQRLDLLDSETARLLLAAPERLTGMIRDPGRSQPIIIDEVQKVPALLDEVHRLIEDRRWKFILTGSSARKLRRGGANLLAGRALQRFFYPLTCWELGDAFDLSRALRYGLLPAVWGHERPHDFLAAYIYTYLKEEVMAEGLTRNLAAFTRFLEMSSFSQAQPLTLAALASDVGVGAKLIASYIEVLSDLLLAKLLPVFTRRAKRRLARHPKFFLFDAGVFRALRPRGPLDSDAEIDGSALETLFLQHYCALGEMVQWDQQIFYWRTAQQAEVDFVSYGTAGLFAFEIKRSTTLRQQDLQGLELFKQDYPMAKCFFLYGGESERTLNGIDVVNFENALWRLPTTFGVTLPSATPR